MNENTMGLLGMAFSLIIVAMSFSIPIVAIIVSHRTRQRREQGRQELIRLAIEKGQPVPPELLTSLPDDTPSFLRRNDPNKHLREGLILMAVGTALYFALGGLDGAQRAWWALMPGLIGVALLISWALEKAVVKK